MNCEVKDSISLRIDEKMAMHNNWKCNLLFQSYKPGWHAWIFKNCFRQRYVEQHTLWLNKNMWADFQKHRKNTIRCYTSRDCVFLEMFGRIFQRDNEIFNNSKELFPRLFLTTILQKFRTIMQQFRIWCRTALHSDWSLV